MKPGTIDSGIGNRNDGTGAVDSGSQISDQKEEMMKRLVSFILLLGMAVVLIGCASTGQSRTAPYAGAKGNWANEVGNEQFVGATNIGVPYQRQLAVDMISP